MSRDRGSHGGVRLLSAGTIDISFAITLTGTITLGVNGELADELTHTLRLGLAPASP